MSLRLIKAGKDRSSKRSEVIRRDRLISKCFQLYQLIKHCWQTRGAVSCRGYEGLKNLETEYAQQVSPHFEREEEERLKKNGIVDLKWIEDDLRCFSLHH